ncbi:MAG: starch-binding protein [Ruminococcus sp.]|nr:starch-binding protein [Ruminococcus sp.]
MKLTKKLLSLLLVLMLAIGCVVTASVSVSAAGDTVYVKVSSTYGTPNCYMWNSDSDKNAAWPGIKMTAEGDGVFSYTPDKAFANVIFNNGSAQTADLTYPGANKIYIMDTGKWEVYDISSAEPTIMISKKDGSSFKTETVTVSISAKNADSAYYTVDGGAQISFTGSADVVLGANTAVGSATTLFVSATNANGTVTSTATYTKKEASAGSDSDGSTAPALDGYYSTNPGGQVGKQASITIDGSISDWDSSMLIAQGVANDDPRVYRPGSMHEIAIDDYALYAAWDNSNLYLMWEVANVQDAIAPLDNFPLTQGNLWIYNLPVFMYFSTDPSIEGDGTVASGATVWDSGITLDANIDTVVAFSTNGSNGPFVYKADEDGKIIYNETRQSGIKLEWGNATISKNLWGIDEGYGHYNNRIPGDTLEESSKWIDYYADPEHKKSLDMFYELSIPFDVLGIDASYIEENGIGLMKVSTFGTSGVNCLPADPSMWDNAAEEYTNDPTTSHEKEDADHITVPLARIGKLLSGSTGGNTPSKPNPTNPTTPQPTQPQPTTPKPTTPNPTNPQNPTTPNPSNPGTSTGVYYLGDADLSGVVNVKDATLIQKVVAGIEKDFKDEALICADATVDTDINVKDATAIQKYVAGIPVSTPIGQPVAI